jgi:hypothetical protein
MVPIMLMIVHCYTGDCAFSGFCQQKGIAAWWPGPAGGTDRFLATGFRCTLPARGAPPLPQEAQLSVEILPDAADTTVSWSVDNGTGQASVSSTDWSAVTGTVTAIATAMMVRESLHI